MQVLNFENEV